jgi:ABC-type transport system involved in cytochrome c biogenesis permease subunit
MRVPLPSLEALDRVNVVTTAVGFALLSLGILTGMAWLRETIGTAWTGTTHEAWMVISWAIYAGLVAARYAGRQGARQAAASALAGFAFLLFGVVGVGVMN